MAAKHGWKVFVVHFNHQLRGRSSDADERFVQKLSARLKLPRITGRADVRKQARERGLSIEMAARELRHEFLARTAKQLGISTIALAHHADDQVESFFLRLLRGAGSGGLGGMKWRAPSPCNNSIQLIRPLLDVGRLEIERFARENKIRFRDDASNASVDILRNRIRHELLPILRRRFQPALNEVVLRLMDILQAESEMLSALARSRIQSPRSGSFVRLPVALQRRVLQQQLQKHRLDSKFDLIERLRHRPKHFVNVDARVSVGRDHRGVVSLRSHQPPKFNPNELAVTLRGRAEEFNFEGVCFHWRFEAVKSGRIPRHRRGCEIFDADAVGDQIVLRHWRPADRFQPIGMRSAVKLQDWFTNQKVPRGLRHQLVVATSSNGTIFWIEDQRITERFKLSARTKRRLVWHWKRL